MIITEDITVTNTTSQQTAAKWKEPWPTGVFYNLALIRGLFREESVRPWAAFTNTSMGEYFQSR